MIRVWKKEKTKNDVASLFLFLFLTRPNQTKLNSNKQNKKRRKKRKDLIPPRQTLPLPMHFLHQQQPYQIDNDTLLPLLFIYIKISFISFHFISFISPTITSDSKTIIYHLFVTFTINRILRWSNFNCR